MAFCIKKTHPLLQTNTQPPKTDNVSMFFDIQDEKSYINGTQPFFPVNQNTQPENRPKDSSSKGLAIRSVPSAQADHM
jgi:hypothetical protein